MPDFIDRSCSPAVHPRTLGTTMKLGGSVLKRLDLLTSHAFLIAPAGSSHAEARARLHRVSRCDESHDREDELTRLLSGRRGLPQLSCTLKLPKVYAHCIQLATSLHFLPIAFEQLISKISLEIPGITWLKALLSPVAPHLLRCFVETESGNKTNHDRRKNLCHHENQHRPFAGHAGRCRFTTR